MPSFTGARRTSLLTSVSRIPGVVIALLAISGTPPSATVGVAFTFTPTTSGGSGVKVFALAGTLPAGLTFSTTTGAVSGTPTTPVTGPAFSISVSDDTGTANLAGLTIVVVAANAALALYGTYPDPTVGVPYSVFPTVSGGTGPFTYGFTGQIPVGFAVSSSTGELAGTATSAGQNFTFAITVTDSAATPATANTGNKTITATVAGVLGPRFVDFNIADPSGTVIIPFNNLNGRTVNQSFTPSNTKVAVSSDGKNLLIGVAASTAGTIRYTFTASDGQTFPMDVTATAVTANTQITPYFTADIASSGWYAGASGPNARRDSVSGKTILAYQAWGRSEQARLEAVKVYDPSTGAYADRVTAFPDAYNDDDHGVPALDFAVIAAKRYVYVFGGAHTNPMRVAVAETTGLTASNTLTFTRLPDVPIDGVSDGYSYPHPVIIGSKCYLYMRKTLSTYLSYVVRVGTINADATITWAANDLTLLQWSDSRCYATDPIIISTSGDNGVIRHAVTCADYGDTQRQDMFCFDHDTSAGLLKSTIGGFTRSTATHIFITESRANLRITTQFENNLYTTIPSHCFDAAGNYHLMYMESPTANSVAPSVHNVKHRVLLAGGSSYSAAQTVCTTQHRANQHNVMAFGSGVEAWATTISSYAYARGGDIKKFVYSAGAWDAGAVIMYADDTRPLQRPCAVRDGQEIKVIWFEESVPPISGNTGGSFALTEKTCPAYAWSGTDFVKGGLHPSTIAWLARHTVNASDGWKIRYDKVISAAFQTDYLSNADTFYITAAHDAQAAKQNIAGTGFNATAQSGVIFTAGRGFKGSGATNGGVLSGYTPTTSGGKMLSGNGWQWGFNLTEGTSEVQDFGTSATVANYLRCRDTAGNAYGRMHGSDINPTGAVPTAVGHLAATFLSKAVRLYKNGEQIASTTSTSQQLAGGQVCLFQIGTGFSTREFAAWGSGRQPPVESHGTMYRSFRRHLISTGALTS